TCKSRTGYVRRILSDWNLTTEEQLITAASISGMTNGVQAPQRSLHVPNIQGNPMKQWIKVLLTRSLLTGLGLPLQATAHSTSSRATTARGLAWRSSQQQAERSFRSNTMAATDWQASTEALQAFANAGQLDHLNTQTLAACLAGLNAHETELL